MNVVSVENLTKSYGEKLLFRDISFGIAYGQRIALIAGNGSGKSTLLKIILGQEIPDSGKVTFRQDVSVGYMEQEPRFEEGKSVYDTLFYTSSPVQHAYTRYTQANESGNKEELEKAILQMDALQAWDYESKVSQILTRLQINWLKQPVESLSGGQLKRLALARVLLQEPKLLILDEPTNHLDIDMIEWLENYVVRNNCTLFLVTHDRYFLDSICTDIYELDAQTIYRYQGNFAYFVEKKAQREAAEQSELEKNKNLYRRELEWMRKMPRARGTKSKSRKEDFYELQDKISGKRVEDTLQLQVKMNRIGGKILEMKKVYKAYGETTILKGFDYTFRKGERLGIVGKNGSGKSTFLNLITGLEQPDSGKINLGETIITGYFSQKGLKLNEEKRVIEVVKEIADVIPLGDGSKLSAAEFLRLFRFPSEMHYTYVSRLSGGEKKRLYLLTVLIRNPNFLILDEPTNDLDLLTLSTLEEFLLHYPGCLIIVSHDRYFMDKLTDHLLVFEGNGQVTGYTGTYTAFRESRKVEEKKQQQTVKSTIQESVSAKKTAEKLTFKEKFELEQLSKQLPELEEKKESLLREMETAASDHEKLQTISVQIQELSDEIDTKTMRWFELSEKEGT